jgi:hypothetical protein
MSAWSRTLVATVPSSTLVSFAMMTSYHNVTTVCKKVTYDYQRAIVICCMTK